MALKVRRPGPSLRVIVNGQVLGHQKLGESSDVWTLEHAVSGAVNTLVIFLVDDAAVHKYVSDLCFWHHGALVEG